MESKKNVVEKMDRNSLVEFLKNNSVSDDEENIRLQPFLQWKSDLMSECGGQSVKFYSTLASLYEDAGLIRRAQDAYYQASYIADRDVNIEDHDKFLKKSQELKGLLDK